MKRIERKQIPDYPEYHADRKGHIWRKFHGYWRIINPVTHHDGYQYTYVGSGHRVLTQRLVCAAFKGLSSEDLPICIRKAKRQQPRRVRSQRFLKWGTRGDIKKKSYLKLTRDEQDSILEQYRKGKTQVYLAQAFGVSQPAISYLIIGKTKLREIQ